ncbi:MAG: GspH/FimT family pseudopilin [Mariprofundaceae bacterium]
MHDWMQINIRTSCELQRNSRKDQGFSLIEMMVVIGIMAIIAAIALPTFSEWRQRAASQTAADSLVAHLKQARIIAISESRSVTFAFTTSDYTMDGRTVELSEYSPVLTLTTANASWTFQSRGTVVNNGDITLATPSLTKIISVNSLGRTFIQ